MVLAITLLIGRSRKPARRGYRACALVSVRILMLREIDDLQVPLAAYLIAKEHVSRQKLGEQSVDIKTVSWVYLHLDLLRPVIQPSLPISEGPQTDE
jgi:hypothetical protein